MQRIRHLILDRDGVLNAEPPSGLHCADPSQFKWLPGSREALKLLHESGVRVSVATNQSAVGRGLMSEADLERVHDEMCVQAAAAGGRIDAVYACIHAPWDGCKCRKPASGLIEAAVNTAGKDIPTLLVGDDVRDLEAGRAEGIRVALVLTGKGERFAETARQWQVPVFRDLAAVAREVIDFDNVKGIYDMDIRAVFEQHVSVASQAATVLPAVLCDVVDVAERCLRGGHKIFACGNGGSASDAQHLTAELIGRFRRVRRALPAVCLTSDPATFSALANDFGFEEVFSRQVEALAAPGDLLIALSTSGNSRNVVRAAETARGLGCTVVALTGSEGGKIVSHADITVRAPSDVVARIQEVHGLCIHVIAEALDERFGH